jgi:hypothetical protein
LAFDLGALAFAHYQAGDYKNAVESQRSNVRVRERIVAANPDDFRAAERFAYALQFLADAEELAQQKPAAGRDYLRAVEVYAHLRRTGTLVQSSLLDYARSIWGVIRLEEHGGAAQDRCVRIKVMGDLIKEYETRAPVASDAYQIAEIRQTIHSCDLEPVTQSRFGGSH